MTYGYVGRVLRVNLSRENIAEEPLSMEWATKYIGGMGLGLRMLYEELETGTDPLSPDNKIILVTGPLTGTIAPCAGKYTLVTKSPLTNIFLDSYAGGYLGAELKYAGYDAVTIEGGAKEPVYLWIDDRNVAIKSAKHLWGEDAHETEDAIKEELGDKEVRVMSIGPAGENLVKIACITTEYYRHHGRGGAGAVFGSKNLKAVAIRGTGSVKVADPNEFLKAAEDMMMNGILESPDSLFAISWKGGGGTPDILGWTTEAGATPTRNFTAGIFEKAEEVGAEAVKKLRLKSRACFQCPCACSNFISIKTGPYAGTALEGPEFETISMLGANCGVGDISAIAKANLLCDKLGLDTMSTGAIIGWAMESFEKGILSLKDTDGLELRFGNHEAMLALIEKIAKREGIGDLLADGVAMASKKVGKGSEKFAMHIKGLEMPAYEPRAAIGMALAYATAGRGCCHLRAWPIGAEVWGSFWLDAKPVKLDRWSAENKAALVIQQQHHYAFKFSSIVCDFALPPTGDFITRMVATATGWPHVLREYLLIGERIVNLIRLFNLREGMTKNDEVLPERLTKEPLIAGPAKGQVVRQEDFERMLTEYYALRGWDHEGMPTAAKLQELGLEEFVSKQA